jgi:hypothetical protein
MAQAPQKDQQHPQWQLDRATLNQLLQAEVNNYNLAELARLKIRYTGFPGARDIQADLDKALQRWQLTEESLYEKTRQIHSEGRVYRSSGEDKEDWT